MRRFASIFHTSAASAAVACCAGNPATADLARNVFSQLVAMGKSLIKDSEDKLRGHIRKGGARAERDGRILREFQNGILDC